MSMCMHLIDLGIITLKQIEKKPQKIDVIEENWTQKRNIDHAVIEYVLRILQMLLKIIELSLRERQQFIDTHVQRPSSRKSRFAQISQVIILV